MSEAGKVLLRNGWYISVEMLALRGGGSGRALLFLHRVRVVDTQRERREIGSVGAYRDGTFYFPHDFNTELDPNGQTKAQRTRGRTPLKIDCDHVPFTERALYDAVRFRVTTHLGSALSDGTFPEADDVVWGRAVNEIGNMYEVMTVMAQ